MKQLLHTVKKFTFLCCIFIFNHALYSQNNCPPVTSVTVSPATICPGNTSTLTANGTIPGATINWYDMITGGTLVGTGNPFVTPTLNITTNYYVEQVVSTIAPTTQTFNYTGGVQTFTVPAGVTSISIEAYGAGGGSGATGNSGGGPTLGGLGGNGSKATGTLAVTPGQVLNIYVGGQGGVPTAGFNGGATGGSQNAGGGGGASDVRYPGINSTDRILVAGGGGGGGRGGCESNNMINGGAGGTGDGNGANGVDAPTSGGNAGAGFGAIGSNAGAAGIGCGGFLGQAGQAGDAFGIGGMGGGGQSCCCFSFASIPGGGGGGGGYLGGGGGGGGSAGTTGCSGNDKGAGGGGAGGSSYIGGVTNGIVTIGVQNGDGQVLISYCDVCTSPRVAATVNVNSSPQVNFEANQTYCAGSNVPAIVFTSSFNGATFNWSRTNEAIGAIPTSGVGNLPAFIATNTGTTPLVSTFTVIANDTTSGITCSGPPIQFTITVNPTAIIDPVANQTICNGNATNSVNFTSNIPGTTFNWTNNTPGIGLAASGSGDIASFIATNTGNTALTATITVTPQTNIPPELLYYQFNGSGTSVPNLASIPPPGTNTADIMGSQTQGGSAICEGTLIGTGNSSSSDYLDTYWAPNLGNSSWTLSFKTSNIIASSTLWYILGDYNSSQWRCFTNGVAGPNNWILRGPVTDVLLPGGATLGTHTNTFVYDNLTANIYAYLDGVLVNTVAQPTLNITGSGPFKVGGYLNSVGLSPNGYMDEFRLYNRALDPTEVSKLVTCNGGSCAGPPITFTITVNPIPDVTVTPVSQTVCSGAPVNTLVMSGNVSGTVYNWTRDNTGSVTGIGASGSGNISGTLINSGNSPITVTFTIIPSFTNNGVECTGIPITATVIVNPTPTLDPVSNQTYCVGSSVPSIIFSSSNPGAVFTWSRTGEAIGLGVNNGIGNIPSFTTTNTGTTPLTSTFSVVASYTAGGVTCFSAPIQFTITVNPTPAVNSVANQTYCVGSSVPSIVFTSPITGGTIVYNWTRTAGAIGLAPLNGIGNIPSFVAANAGTTVLSSTFTVTASFTNNGVTCTSAPITFTISVNPAPQVNAVPNVVTCNGALTLASGAIIFSSSVPGTTFNWTNSNATIGIGASGTGNIPQFTAINTGTTTIVATITVTPVFTNIITCTGTPISFTITITPSPVAACKNATIYLNNAGTATLLTSDVNNGSVNGVVSLSKTTFNCSNVGVNTVILTVTDACGKTATCSAIVTVVDNIPPTINGIIAPSITVQCDQSIPAAPTVTATDNCSAVLTFTETSTQSKWLQLCEHYQYVITRLWIAVDPSGNTTTKQQLINVIDNKAPVMTMLPLNNLTAFCDEGEIHGCPIPIDNCDQTPSLLFEFHYEPYLGLDGCTNSYTVIRKWTAGDKCGNTTVITQTIYVVDKEKPELTCPANIVKTSDKPIAVTWTAPKAHDDCDGELVASQIAGPKNGSTFDPGTTTKITYVTVDNCGNTDTCSFFITINKGTTTNTGAKISGAVKSMNGSLIENAEVDINGDVNQFTSTVKGSYEFAGVTKGSKEKVSVKKSSNPLEGVNTLDLVFITNHILGKKALNSPYKILAADVNNSESITTADLVELRKLILHITDKFANVDSWEFLPTTTTFSSQFNPWKDPIVSDVQIDNIQTDQVADFNGIKMGDVTWDATGTASGAIEVKSNEIYTLKAENKEYRKGDNVEMIVSGKELDGMKGMQFTMEYNPAILEYVSVKGMREDIGEENFGMRYMENGKITGSIDLRGEKLGDDLFKFTFKAKETGSLLNSIRMTSSLTKAEAYTKTDESNGLSLSFTQNGKEIAITTAVLYQNEPNPFESNTVIRFFVPETQEATLSIFTLDGKLVKEINEVYTKGEHQVNVAKEEFPSSGIYYYQLKTNNFTDTKKMMYVK